MDTGTGCQSVGTVAVIGGGASGTLVATHLLNQSERPIDVVVLEPNGLLAGGVAYSTTEPSHLLNSPACEMSAWSRDADDFRAYLEERGLANERHTFASRRTYRDYLLDCLSRARRAAHPMSGFEVRGEEAVALVRSSSRLTAGRILIGLRHGAHIEADHVVLAVGAPMTVAPWRAFPGVAGRDLVEDPWARGALDDIGRDDRVLLAGTGLTAIDVVLSLQARGHRGQLYLRSRHGLLPERQLDVGAPPRRLGLDPAVGSARELVAALRVAAEKETFEGGDWRSVIAGFRSELPALWQQLDLIEQARLLRHAARYWEVHRHRMAPEVAVTIDALRCSRQLDVRAGRISELDQSGRELRVHLEHGRNHEELTVDAVVNCTGPSRDYRRSRLVGDLLETGIATEDPHGLGLRVDEQGDLVDATGVVDSRLHTMGWLRRAKDYESTSVPELRSQAEQLASRLGVRR